MYTKRAVATHHPRTHHHGDSGATSHEFSREMRSTRLGACALAIGLCVGALIDGEATTIDRLVGADAHRVGVGIAVAEERFSSG
jgi:hypothetical protein